MPGLLSAAEIGQQIGSLHEDNQKLLETAHSEERDLTPEEDQEFDRREAEIDRLTKNKFRIEKHEARQKELAQSSRIVPAAAPEGAPVVEERDNSPAARSERLIRTWLALGTDGDVEVSDEDRAELQAAGMGGGSVVKTFRMSLLNDRQHRAWRQNPVEFRQQATTPGTAGGYLIPEGFSNELEQAMLQYTGMREVNSRIIRTATGNSLPWPTVNDTTNKGAILAENTEDTTQDVTYGQITFGAYKFTSKIVKVSLELMQDSAFDMNSHIGSLCGERIGRIHNEMFTVGTGTGQPQGVMTAAPVGKTASSLSAITWPEIVDLEHSVDRAYRSGAEWMMSDNTLAYLKKLEVGTGDSRPLFLPSISVGAPLTLLGYPYTTNNDVADIGASAKTVAFGNFQKFGIRDVLDITLRRLDERYAEFHQVAFVAISRNDSRLIDAGTGPIKVLDHPAT